MIPVEDPLSPRSEVFAEPWHAQTLAAAHAMIRAGHCSAQDWAMALGAALKGAEARGDPDTDATYYLAALDALERITPLNPEDLNARKAEWAAAYWRTPHGKPVLLTPP